MAIRRNKFSKSINSPSPKTHAIVAGLGVDVAELQGVGAADSPRSPRRATVRRAQPRSARSAHPDHVLADGTHGDQESRGPADLFCACDLRGSERGFERADAGEHDEHRETETDASASEGQRTGIAE